MADDRNDSLSIEPTTDAPTPAEGTSEQEAPRPRRRGRKPKAEAAADAAPAPAADAAAAPEGGEDAPKPRRTRARRVSADAEAAEGQAPEVSPEVAQARALAQVSQAQVVRRQRREAEAAAELIASPGAPAASGEPSAAPAAGDAPASAPEAAEAPKPRRGRPRKKDAAADPVAAATAAVAASELTPEMLAAIPKVDPALRPHRRGRKPKAYVEAERKAAEAAAALLAQQQGAEVAGTEAVAPADAKGAPAADGAAPAEKDTRPGRGRRGKNREAAEERAERREAKDRDEAASEAKGSSQDSASRQGEGQGRERRAHGQQRHGEHSERNDRGGRNDRGDRKGNRAERNDRRNGKRGGRYANAPTEPSLSRDDLSAMKVAELRDRARELDIDTAGKKKAELVEEVYAAAARAEGFREIEGILDITNEGFGYIRAHGYMPSRDDAFVPANMIRAARLRPGDLISGTLRPSRANDKFPGLSKIHTVNGLDPEEIRTRPKFSELTPIYPNEPLKMEHGRDSITGRAIDIVSPIGKGQRGLIVSPPKAGKTTILKKICQSISVNNPEVHLICLLVDERPEEVTDMERSIKGDVVASTFDMPADNHTRVSELVIERAKRIVELGGDVVVVLDSITRLARAYNLAAPASGRILSGGVDSAALYPPKRFLGAARNIENGGSLTILASALVDTGSKMDEVIFEEFKGTGNMELKLDRDLADRRIFPAIDPVASGTRNEDLLIDQNLRPFVWGIRRVLANMNNTERAAASFIKGLKGTNSNEEFLIRTAKKAADHPEVM